MEEIKMMLSTTALNTKGVVPRDLNFTVHSKRIPVDHRCMHSKNYVEACMGVYPTMDQALRQITKDGKESVAISRELALYREGANVNIFIKGDQIGWMVLGGDKKIIVLKRDVSWVMRSILEKHGITDINEGL